MKVLPLNPGHHCLFPEALNITKDLAIDRMFSWFCCFIAVMRDSASTGNSMDVKIVMAVIIAMVISANFLSVGFVLVILFLGYLF